VTIKIVLDACVIIDLDLEQIQLIDAFLQFLDQVKEYEIFISTDNFEEVENRYHSAAKRKLSSKSHFNVITIGDEEKTLISEELESLRINIPPKDRMVLISAISSDADFIITSDTGLSSKIVDYRRRKRITQKLIPLTTVGLLKIFFENKIFGSEIYFEKSLALFKFKEIDNIFSHLSDEDLRISTDRQRTVIDGYNRLFKERFQIYKDPLVKIYNDLIQRGLIRI
jgi:putative PIN family toxin of toxin-antitoxin system